MTPHDSQSDSPKEPQRLLSLPEHLRFVGQAPDMEMIDSEELSAWGMEYLHKLRTHRDELIAHGIDADKCSAKLKVLLDAALGKTKEYELVHEKELQLTADLADAQYEAFKLREKIVRQKEEVNPFDLQLQELKEQLEELRKHMPKE